jgi:hypothetical protein
MMIAHFFDIDTLIKVDSSVWIISKTNPTSPLLKINQSDFNLIKKGIWFKKGVSIRIGGKEYWISEELFEQIKTKCKRTNTDITTLSFSLQEFMNSDVISSLKTQIMTENLYPLRNSSDDIYLICSKNTEENYKFLIEKLEQYMSEIGIKFKNTYFISETFYNRDEDNITHKKVRLLIQHLIGLKTDGDKFTEEEITRYQTINFYDTDLSAINLSKSANDVLDYLYNNSEKGIQEEVKVIIDENNSFLSVNLVTFNLVNPKIKSIVNLGLNKVTKSFESFKFRH